MANENTTQDDYNPKIVENKENDDVQLDRWQKYGKDRLYINGETKDNFYADLTQDQEDGHNTANSKKVTLEDGKVIFEWKTGWSRSWTEHKVVVELKPNEEEEEVKSEVPPNVPYNAQTAGKAQQANAQRILQEANHEDCPKCGSENTEYLSDLFGPIGHKCHDCGEKWNVKSSESNGVEA